MKNIKHFEEKMITKEKFINWLNEPNSQPLSLKQFGSCYTYLKAPQNDDFLYCSAGSIRPRPTGNGERCKPQSKKAEIRKNPTRPICLTELLICGKCGTAYRRAVWSKNGKKKAVWRCISRMEYGKKYCPDSPTLEETAVQRAVVDAIQEVVNADGCQAALKNLPLHMRMFYGAVDENSIANDEMSLEQLKSMVMEMDGKDNITGEDFITLSKEFAEVKKVIAEKKNGRPRLVRINPE